MKERDEYLKNVTVGERKPLNAKIDLHEYDAQWAARFARVEEEIREALGDGALMVEHVGSTSVAGLCAKPIIDILLVIVNSADEPAYVPRLESGGFTLRIREPEWFEHRMFKGPGGDINLHVFSEGASEIQMMLRFRDWLRANEADRMLYAQTKRELASRVWKDIQDYADAKSAVVAEIMKRALSAGK